MTSLADFQSQLLENPGILIFKFGAEWCGPCKMIESQLHAAFQQMPRNVKCVVVDIDESSELHGFMKKKRILNGVPAIIAYYRGNTHYIPDDCVFGANPPQIDLFFARCYNKATE
jgi:thioredoxin 1